MSAPRGSFVVASETRVAIASVEDVVTARQKGRSLAQELGFEGADVTLITAAISEVSRNIAEHAKCGEIILRPENHGARRGLCVVARDEGPGIANLDRKSTRLNSSHRCSSYA